jgi:hypothetical protein
MARILVGASARLRVAAELGAVESNDMQRPLLVVPVAGIGPYQGSLPTTRGLEPDLRPGYVPSMDVSLPMEELKEES